VKISEVCQSADVKSSTLKYYVREGLVPEGRRLGSNQTEYDETHVQRVKLVRALIETGGLSVAATKRVLLVLDSNEHSLAYAFEAAQHALGIGGTATTRPASRGALQRVAELITANSWTTTDDNPGLEVAARALDGLTTIGFSPSDEFLAAYASAAAAIARADLAALTSRDRPDLIAELMVVGTVMGDALAAGLRRLAQQNETAAVFPLPDAQGGKS
jgi:DNA-binding transcriptional MerR regulator